MINDVRLGGEGKTACVTAQLVTPNSTYGISIPRPTFRFFGDLSEVGMHIDTVLAGAAKAEIARHAVNALQRLGIEPVLSATEYQGVLSHLNRKVGVADIDEIAKLLAVGRDCTEIAIQLGRTSWSVFRVARRLRSREGTGLTDRQRADLRAEELRLKERQFEEVVRFWRQTLSS